MRLLGIVLLAGGFLIRLLTSMSVLGWVLMGIGAVMTVVFSVTKKKLR
jgi:hypothetical protein